MTEKVELATRGKEASTSQVNKSKDDFQGSPLPRWVPPRVGVLFFGLESLLTSLESS